jgi:hypothetical protein
MQNTQNKTIKPYDTNQAYPLKYYISKEKEVTINNRYIGWYLNKIIGRISSKK